MRKLLFLLLVGCETSAPFVPETAIPYEAPPVYSVWWSEVEKDAGVDGDMSGIQWYEVPGGMFYHPGWDKKIGGMWSRDRKIYMAEGSTDWRGAVKHEMLHDLLNGDLEHKHPLFRTYASQ